MHLLSMTKPIGGTFILPELLSVYCKYSLIVLELSAFLSETTGCVDIPFERVVYQALS